MLPKRSLVILLSVIVITALAGISVRFAIAQFTEPSTTPPGDNPLPIWVSLPNGTIYHTTGGNVGIGTVSPGGKLTISMGSGDYGGVEILGENYSSGDPATRLRISDATGGTNWYVSANNDGSFAVHQGGVADRLTVLSNGNVGIGTTSPGAKLEVNGNMYLFGNLSVANIGIGLSADASNFYVGPFVGLNVPKSLVLRAGGREGLRITTAGNVGIGTTTPDHPFHVASPSTQATNISLQNTSSGGKKYSFVSTGQFHPSGPGRLVITDGSTDFLYVNNGKVGIKSQPDPTPGTNFSVFGNARVYGVVQEDSWKLLAKGNHSTEQQVYYLTSSGVGTAHVGCNGCENDFNVDTQMYSWPSNITVREIRYHVRSTTDGACVGDRTCDLYHYHTNNTYHYHGRRTDDDWTQIWINGSAKLDCPGHISGYNDAGWLDPNFGGNRFTATCTYGVNAALTEIRVDETDWSGSHGGWDWEIWWR